MSTEADAGQFEVWITARREGTPGDAGWNSHAAVERFRADAARFNASQAAQTSDARDGFAILSAIPQPNLSLLDVGCGFGHWSRLLELGPPPLPTWSYHGLEQLPEQVEVCRAFNPDAGFSQGDGRQLPFENDSFDVVLSSGVLMYLPAWMEVLGEYARVARRFVVLLRTPVIKYTPTTACQQHVTSSRGQETHGIEVFNRDDLHRAFASAGMNIAALDYSDIAHPVEGLPERLFYLNYLLSAEPMRLPGRSPGLLLA